MKSIGFWRSQTPSVVPDVALVHADETDDFVGHITNELIPKPEIAYQLSPNARGKEKALLFYLKCNTFSDPAYVIDSELATSSALIAWEEMISALRTWNIPRYRAARCILATCDELQCISDSRLVMDALDTVISTLVVPLTELLPFAYESNQRHADWWDYRTGIRKRVEVPARVALAHLHVGSELEARIKAIVEHTTHQLARLEQLPPTDAIYELSIYCMSLAIKFDAQQRWTAAFILVHRALDYFIQHIAIRESLVVLTTLGFKYDDNERRKTGVSLWNSHRFLIDDSKLAWDKDRVRFLEWLNESRNQAVYAHGVYGFSPSDSRRAINGALNAVSRIEGSGKWNTLANRYLAELEIPASSLFALDGALDTHFQVLHVAAKQ